MSAGSRRTGVGRSATRAGCRLISLLAALATGGCAILGPRSIEYGRSAYNDALISTNNEQVLATIVRMRYGEPTGLLAVSSVTANLNLQTSIGSEFGIGADRNYEGNLTPLSAGFAYEENPTISYTPVQGERYLRHFLAPLPIDLVVLLLGTLGNSPRMMTLLVRSINGVANPTATTDPSAGSDPRFARIAELLADITRSWQVEWAAQPDEPRTFALLLSGEGPIYERRVGELYDLLGFDPPRDFDQVLSLPVHMGIGRPKTAAIRLRTRSLFDLFTIAAASVEVPEEHVQSGLAPPLPAEGAAAGAIRIRGSSSRPWGAMVAFKRHGWWYFLDPTDAASKLSFRILESLLSVQLSAAADHRAAPVLTVPVSR